MMRPPGAAGFDGRATSVASSRLTGAVGGLARDRCVVAVPDRLPHGAFDQGFHGDADSGVTNHFPGIGHSSVRQRAMISIAIGNDEITCDHCYAGIDAGDPAGRLVPDRHGNAGRRCAWARQ